MSNISQASFSRPLFKRAITLSSLKKAFQGVHSTIHSWDFRCNKCSQDKCSEILWNYNYLYFTCNTWHPCPKISESSQLFVEQNKKQNFWSLQKFIESLLVALVVQLVLFCRNCSLVWCEANLIPSQSLKPLPVFIADNQWSSLSFCLSWDPHPKHWTGASWVTYFNPI